MHNQQHVFLISTLSRPATMRVLRAVASTHSPRSVDEIATDSRYPSSLVQVELEKLIDLGILTPISDGKVQYCPDTLKAAIETITLLPTAKAS